MKIKVNRSKKDSGEMVFEIVVSNPRVVSLQEHDKTMLDMWREIEKKASCISDQNAGFREDFLDGVQLSKEKILDRVLTKLQFSIKNDLEVKFNPICQEIYNWIVDSQEGYLKNWMLEVDPHRSRYYFDNDKNIIVQEDDEEEDED